MSSDCLQCEQGSRPCVCSQPVESHLELYSEDKRRSEREGLMKAIAPPFQSLDWMGPQSLCVTAMPSASAREAFHFIVCLAGGS